ncbi:MFS transporter [Ligilactobacillus sp. LYQ60]|uniref:MFS transporter n=1 Tax=unclassified Ligilactobacillus TaxID=2767920 RepID=UPI0038525E88
MSNKLRLVNDNRAIYLGSLFIYNLARVLPHAVLTVILLNKGMTVAKIAIIQSFFMLAAIIFDLPSGFLTDLWSEKLTYEVSLILITVSYMLTMVSSSFIVLCCSWFIYGISSATINGSLDAYFIRRANGDNEQIKHVNVLINHTTLYSGLIGGGVGSFIYQFMNIRMYWLSLILLVVAFGLIVGGFHPQRNENDGHSVRPSWRNVLSDFKMLLGRRRILCVIGLCSVYQIVAQLFFQFWQINFLKQHFSKAYFGIFYVVFQVIAIISNHWFSHCDFSQALTKLVILLGGGFLLAIMAPSKYIFLLLVICFLFPFNIYNSQLMVNMQQEVTANVMSSMMSLTETCASGISILTLWIVGLLDQHLPFLQVEGVLVFVYIISSCWLIWLYQGKRYHS